MTNMRAPTSILLAAALLAGCQPSSQPAAASVCDEATQLAAAAMARAKDAASRAKAVRPEPVDPDLATTPDPSETGFAISPMSEAKIEAERAASHERRRLTTEAHDQATRWATIIEQNPDCFGVEQRANAADFLRP